MKIKLKLKPMASAPKGIFIEKYTNIKIKETKKTQLTCTGGCATNTR